MPRSNMIGGKHHKKGKKNRGPVNLNHEAKVEMAGLNQIYGLVKKKIGGSRLTLECSDGKTRSAIIPGKFFKKVWMSVGDILLCDLNIESDDEICYICHKYTIKDATVLKSQGKITFEILDDKDEIDGIKYIDNSNIEQSRNGNDMYEIGSNDSDTDNDILTIKNPNRDRILKPKNDEKGNNISEASENSDDDKENSGSDTSLDDL